MTERGPIDPLAATEAPAAPAVGRAGSPRDDVAQTLDSSGSSLARLDLSALPEGLAVGRYVVLERAGQGALGVVYKAYDRELDRFVAIKLLRVRARTAEGADDARVRLLREAQALAKLDHPNVIPVFDVGLHGQDVFLAMAFVEGRTLSDWLEAQPRTAGEILGVFLAAGEGLAAAHRAGLVHRDFKPDNVLVGADGSVRVLDFGLARPVGRTERSAPDVAVNVSFGATSSDSLPLHSVLTQVGSRVGTPLYMAPEQHLGAFVDARADQFAFCVALHEALHGEHPFDAGGTVRDLVAAVTSGRMRTTSRRPGVSRGVVKALRRGLAREPEDRFPSMEELLRALRKRSAPRLPLVIAGLAAIAVAGAAGAVVHSRYERAMTCADAGSRLAGVWDDGQRRALGEAFRRAGIVGVDGPFARTSAALDRYAAAWAAMRREACEATEIRHEQSAEMLDLRDECLVERLDELRGEVGLLERADPATLADAPRAVGLLPGFEPCADAAALRAPVRPPADEATRARVSSVRSELALARAEQRVGQYRAAGERANRLAAEAASLAYRPLEAEALYVLADTEDDQGDYALAEGTFHRSLAAALAGRHEAQAARTLVALVAEVGLRQARFAEGHRWAELARGATERLADKFLAGELARNEGRTFYRENKLTEARASIARCLELWASKDDSAIAGALTDLGNIDYSEGNARGAREHWGRSLEIQERLYGRDSASLAANLNNLGEIASDRGEYDVAAPLLERAHALWLEALGPKHPKVALALAGMARVSAGRGDLERSLAQAKEALAVLEEVLTEDHPDVAEARHVVAAALEAAKDYDGAIAEERRALAARERALGANHADVAESLTSIGEALLARGDPASAVAPLERAVAIREAHPGTMDCAESRFDLARAIGAADETRSRALASQARATLATEDAPRAQRTVAAIDAWLAERGRAP